MFILIILRAERDIAKAAKESESAETEILMEKLNNARKEEAINLADRVITFSTRSLRVITEILRTSPRGRPDDFVRMKNRMLLNLFRDIRSVFEGDTRGVDTTTWPHNYFKIALFEVENDEYLRRTFYDYPEGIEPSSETERISIKQRCRAAHVLAFLTQSIVIIEDIATENKKPADVKRWMNLRENQADEYASMVCAAIVSGTRNQPDRKCLGVLVIDTNRERYFREDRSFQTFLGQLLNPFRTVLTLILESEAYFPKP